MADHIQTSAIAPEVVLCSSARRARETLEGVAPPGEPVIEHELYEASAEDLIDRLRRLPDDVSSVMVIGHNPALETLVLRLSRRDDADPSVRAAVERKFPTGALATLTFECGWSELGAERARITAFVTPKGLSASSQAA